MEECRLKDKCKKYPQCEDYCIKKFKIETLCDKALLTKKQRRYISLYIDADGTDREAFKTLKDIEKSIKSFVSEGRCLYINSTHAGNGKTSWSLRLLNAYIEKIWAGSDLSCAALFVHVPQFLLALKDNISSRNEYAEHIKENILDANLVVFDEIGTKSLTVYEGEHLLSIINSRIDSGKSNIYTSNLRPEELKEVLGERLYSRIVNNSYNITLLGQDKRGIQ